MTNEDYTRELLDIAHRLTLLATGESPGELPLDHPPGTIPVKPEGVLGKGKVRYWPEPIDVTRMDGSTGKELCWSYALRMTYLKNADGEPLVPPIYRQQIGEWMIKVAPSPEQWRMYPAVVDKWVFPEDHMTQQEIDERLRSDQQWADDYRKKYGV